MTVSELIEQLKKLPGDLRLILQSDPEGNGYHWIDGAEIGIPDDPKAWRPDYIYSLNYTAKDNDMEEDEWEDMKQNAEKVVVIYP